MAYVNIQLAYLTLIEVTQLTIAAQQLYISPFPAGSGGKVFIKGMSVTNVSPGVVNWAWCKVPSGLGPTVDRALVWNAQLQPGGWLHEFWGDGELILEEDQEVWAFCDVDYGMNFYMAGMLVAPT